MHTTQVRALVLAAALALGAVLAMPANASASPEIVPASKPELSVDFGWITATIYFNRYETNRLANYGYSSGVLCGVVGAVSGGTAALACLIGFPRIVDGAQSARNAGQCVGLRFYIGSPTINWTIRHSGSRC